MSDGSGLGKAEGCAVRREDGFTDGCGVGYALGRLVGLCVGFKEG